MKCKLNCQKNIEIQKKYGGKYREIICPVCGKKSVVYIGE